MKIKLLTLLLFFGSLLLSAQQVLDIEPMITRKQVTISAQESGYEEVMKATVVNTSNRRLRLRWDKTVEYQPYIWQSQVCDKEASYPPEITSNYDPIQGVTVPVVLEAGESFDLFLTVSPYNVSGQAKIQVVFRDIDRPAKTLGIATFQINLTDEEDRAKLAAAGNRLTVYPNPVHDRFFLNNAPPELGRIDIYNTLGRKVRSYADVQPGDSFAAGDLPQGVYLLSLIDKDGKAIRTMRLLRRDFRP